MFRSLILLIGAALVVVPNIVCALETVRVVVLPFEVHSVKDLSYMKTEIPGIIKKHLQQAGAVVADLELPPEFSWEKMASGIDGIRNLGVQSGADYVVWGSLTWIGQQFSMDAKLMKAFGEEPPSVVFAEGKSIEHLLGTVKKLTDKISLRLFKRETVTEVLIAGNKRIESDAIKRVIKTAPGDVLLAKNLSDDLKAVYSMGYFDDIRVEAADGAAGKIITFKVKEKPTVRKIHLKGNKRIKDEDIQEALTIRTGSILNINRIHDALEQIKNLYREKNYHNVQIAYEV
ncbi:POTRA domain-containing protein, partial [Thermodesulfobacteriota bacterium]